MPQYDLGPVRGPFGREIVTAAGESGLIRAIDIHHENMSEPVGLYVTAEAYLRAVWRPAWRTVPMDICGQPDTIPTIYVHEIAMSMR